METNSKQLANVGQSLFPLDRSGKLLYSNIQELKHILDQAPRPQWIKTNPYANNAKYIPIGVVEELLNMLFPFWQVEQHGEPKMIGNSVVVSVHLKVFHPILNDWLTYAGVGAVPIELAKGSRNAIDFENLNPKALHKNVPAAMAYAVSNAAKKIGKIFGSRLNRDYNGI